MVLGGVMPSREGGLIAQDTPHTMLHLRGGGTPPALTHIEGGVADEDMMMARP